MAIKHHEPMTKTAAAGKGWHKAILSLTLCFLAQYAFAQASAIGKVFETPDAAVTALVKALKENDQAQMGKILGADGDKLINSGDEVADKRGRERFVRAYNEAYKLVLDGSKRQMLVIGKNEWPYPIPLVRSEGGWFFDTQQADDEILARRIGRNEYSALRVLFEIVDAEREYAAMNRTEDGKPVYAAKIDSSEGRQDGLYWPVKEGETLSPIGELVAAAANEGYSEEGAPPLAPYHGYLYRILTSQGKGAAGGEQDYFEDGRMTRGFAAIAYPARYGASGVMTFIINHEGQVFEKNLGPDTAEIAATISSFNPDAGWKQVDPPAE